MLSNLLDPTTLLIAFLLLILILVVIGRIVTRRRNAEFEAACRERGWDVSHLRGPAFDQVIRGETDGILWQYEAYSYSRSSSDTTATNSRYTRWLTTAVSLPEDIVLLIPGVRSKTQLAVTLQSLDRLGGIARTFMEMFVTQGLKGDQQDAERFMALNIVDVGSEAFRQQYTVFATNQDPADKLLRRGESALLEWTSNPVATGHRKGDAVLLWSKGLMIPVERMITDINLLDGLTNLGVALANGIKGW